MPRPIHFEIPADEPERAIGFYESVFGWKFSKWEGPMPYWLISTGAAGEPGIDGGLMPRQPGATGVNTIGVESVDGAARAVAERGGRITAPKTAIPGVGWLVYCTDTEGNPFGMMQADEAAK